MKNKPRDLTLLTKLTVAGLNGCALAIWTQWLSGDLDILISDVMMGALNGIEAALQIRGLLPVCKIFLISGQQATSTLLEEARAQGHEFEILAKPLHPTDLLARIHR